MWIYLFVFAISATCFNIAQKAKHKKVRRLIILIGILIPAVLAGCRKDNIGTDTQNYNMMFERAANSDNYLSFIQHQVSLGTTDMGFYTIAYIISRFTLNYNWALFVYQFITILVMYIAFKNYNKIYNTSIPLGMLLYYLSLYNISLNAIRQCLAVSLVFLSTYYLLIKKYKIYILLLILAFSLHSSAIIGIVFLPVYLLLKVGQPISERKQILRGIIIVLGLFVIILVASEIVEGLVDVGLLRETYLGYLDGGRYSVRAEGKSIPIGILLIQTTYLIVFISHYRLMNAKKQDGLFFVLNSGLVLLITTLGPTIADYITRISYSFIPLQMLGLTNTVSCYKKNSKSIWSIIIIGIVLIHWIRVFAIAEDSNTIPYQFFWN